MSDKQLLALMTAILMTRPLDSKEALWLAQNILGMIGINWKARPAHPADFGPG